ncbi:MAG: hypothetical protein P1S46_06250 [bacterium]|nr:hypothetical protein [bacterium]
MSSEIAIPESHVPMSLARPPEVVLREAQQVATALKDVVEKAGLAISMGKDRGGKERKHLQLEAWQTAGMMFGCTASIVWSRQVDVNGAAGYEARAEVLAQDGSVISAAEAMCLNDEEKWSTKPKYEWVDGRRRKVGDEPVPMFQLRSMAQTRAMAKALKNVLSWIVVLAGYQPTPAEEMDDRDGGDSPGEPGGLEHLDARIRELGEALGKGKGTIDSAISGSRTKKQKDDLVSSWERALKEKEPGHA